MSPVLSGSKRSLAESGGNLTLVGSPSTAAAIARQKSTSKPVQLPLSSGLEKPGSPWLTPQTREPRSFTFLSVGEVCADATAVTQRPSTNTAPKTKTLRFMEQPFMGHTPSSFERNLQRIPRDLRGIGGGTVLNATFSERADVPAGIVRPAQARAPDPLWSAGVSQNDRASRSRG